jgi:hypothetical protein
VESLATTAMMSAQETVCGQACSSAALISSMTSYPRSESRFGMDRFSVVNRPLPSASSSTDASQPCTKQSWKCIRSSDAAMRGSLACSLATMAPMTACICGHEWS